MDFFRAECPVRPFQYYQNQNLLPLYYSVYIHADCHHNKLTILMGYSRVYGLRIADGPETLRPAITKAMMVTI
jgi:hypothetical protein